MQDDKSLENFCHNIARLRSYHKISQRKMAELLGIGCKTLRRLERGEMPERLGCNILVRVYHHFRVPPKDLFTAWPEDDGGAAEPPGEWWMMNGE